MDDFRYKIHQYKIAKGHCRRIYKYETLIEQPIPIIQEILDILQIEADPKDIVSKTLNLSPPAPETRKISQETMLHSGHFTNTREDEWRTLLP